MARSIVREKQRYLTDPTTHRVEADVDEADNARHLFLAVGSTEGVPVGPAQAIARPVAP